MDNLIQTSDYPKERYSAYWEITLTKYRNSEGEFRFDWTAQILSRAPVGYLWQGEKLSQWPAGVPAPIYPEPPTDEARRLEKVGEHAKARALMAAWRAECSKVYEGSPKALHLVEEGSGAIGEWKPEEDAEQAARTASQQWVLDRIEKYRREEVA